MIKKQIVKGLIDWWVEMVSNYPLPITRYQLPVTSFSGA